MKKLISLIMILSVIVCGLAIGVSAEEESTSVAFTWEPVYMTDDIVVFDLCVDPGSYDVAQFSGYVTFSENMVLESGEFLYNKGMCMTSPTVDVVPWQFIWINGVEGLPEKNLHILRLNFAINKDSVFFDLNFSLDPENPVGTVDGDEVTDVVLPAKTEFSIEDFKAPTCNTNVGDPDGSGKINVADVSLLMKHLARWTVDNIDLTQADVNGDGKINVADASHMMKYLAKWNTVRLGHNDFVEVVVKNTCQTGGETRLICKNCGDIAVIETSPTSCSYVKTTLVAPTCVKDGTDKYTCSMCGDSYTKAVKATGKHNYENDKCTMCGKADPNAKTPLQKFCDWLKNNGTYSDGEYYVSTTVSGMYTSVTYNPAEKEIRFACVHQEGSYYFTGITYVPINATASTKYDFLFSGIGADGVTYFLGWENMTASEFLSKDHLDFDEAYSDVDDTYSETEEQLGWSLNLLAISGAKKIINSSGTGLTLASLGFKGF